MIERLFGFMFEKREKGNAAITIVRKNPRFNADEFALIGRKDFRNEKEKAEFFNAVFYSRSHI